MKARAAIAFLLLALIPASVTAATLQADETLNVSDTPAGNAYLAGTQVRVEAPIQGDLLAAAGTLEVFAPVAGDMLAAAGTVAMNAPVAGDMRAAGGRIRIDSDVGGELAMFGGVVTVTGKVNEIRAAGGTVELRSGAGGPVTVYGANVLLSGEFGGNVRVVASDHVALAEGTIIHGSFDYNAPQEAGIPASAEIDGGANYVGSSSFLPTAQEAKTFALAGLGIFFLVRLVAAMLAAGLVAGLFPAFGARIAETTIGHGVKRFILLTLLGFGIIFATPVLLLLLIASFVGIGIAALVGALYLLLLLLGYLYAAVLTGSAFMRIVMKRNDVTWKGAVLGMGILGLIGLIPVLGLALAFLLSSAALGGIVAIAYRFAFGYTR